MSVRRNDAEQSSSRVRASIDFPVFVPYRHRDRSRRGSGRCAQTFETLVKKHLEPAQEDAKHHLPEEDRIEKPRLRLGSELEFSWLIRDLGNTDCNPSSSL